MPSEATAVLVELADPESQDAQRLLVALSETLQGITGSSGAASFDVSDVKGERACFVIARMPDGSAAGCGAIRPLEPGVAELKRMFAVPGSRGVGSALLSFLEEKAGQFGYEQVWLETRKVNTRAVAFYERHGYQTIGNFGRYIGRPEAVCLGKRLTLTSLRHAHFPSHRDEVAAIFREYVLSPSVNLDFQDYETEFAGLPGKYAEDAGGRIVLAWQGDAVVGCAALRQVSGAACELKRVYVRPSVRGQGVGRQLVKHMIREARKVGYATMYLDVLPEFVAAQQLYESLGFSPAEAVSYNPVPGTKFLALSL